VREHEGSIDCDSVVGQGTRFTLAFPSAPAERAARAAQQ
jgi:signal transduction histidine kinase